MNTTSLSLVALAAAAAVAWTPANQAVRATRTEAPVGRLYVLATDDLATGALLDVRGGPPWDVRPIAVTGGAQRLRRFGADLFAIDIVGGALERVPLDGGPTEVHDLGAQSEPQDVCVAEDAGGARVAWVSRRHDPRLFRLDLASGNGADGVDLSPVARGSTLELGTMIRDGSRLLVQVKVLGSTDVPGSLDAGLLAVVDLTTETLLDVVPGEPGVQGVELAGAPPQHDMQIVEGTRTLFVAANQGALDGRGAIERVDLDTLESIGFALSEQQPVADLGAFVMTSPDAGYFVFHTDFAASTHVKPFTIQGGPAPGPEILVFLGDQVGELAYDAGARRLYVPSRWAGGPAGVYVIDTSTDQLVPGGPIPTGLRAHDVVVGP